MTSSGVALADLTLQSSAGPLGTPILVSTDGSELPGSEPSRALDGNPATSWRNDNLVPLLFGFSSANVVTSFRLTTSSVSSQSDPVRWLLQGATTSNPSAWTLLQDQSSTDYSMDTARGWTSPNIQASCPTAPKVGASGSIRFNVLSATLVTAVAKFIMDLL